MTYRLTVEYDGSNFSGWARQPGRRTVQEELERALEIVSRRPISLTVAGRTDKGVHASGQVVSYEGPPVNLRSVNALLPPDIAVISSEVVPFGFSARHDAISRTYLYRLLPRQERGVFERKRALWWPHSLDRQLLEECAAVLPGRHDFTAFTPTQTSHRHFQRRIFLAEWRQSGQHLDFWIEGDAFLRSMVRILVGTMLEVASGRRQYESWLCLLEGRPRSESGVPVPAHGLYLMEVRYSELKPGSGSSPRRLTDSRRLQKDASFSKTSVEVRGS